MGERQHSSEAREGQRREVEKDDRVTTARKRGGHSKKQAACQAVLGWAQKQVRKLCICTSSPFLPEVTFSLCHPQTLFTTIYVGFFSFSFGYRIQYKKCTSIDIQIELRRWILSRTTYLKVNWKLSLFSFVNALLFSRRRYWKQKSPFFICFNWYLKFFIELYCFNCCYMCMLDLLIYFIII